MERPSVAGCASFAGWLEEERGGWKEGTCTDGPITQPATDGTVPLVCCFLWTLEPGTGLSPALDSRDAQKRKRKKKKKVLVLLSAFLSQEKKGRKQKLQDRQLFQDGWMVI